MQQVARFSRRPKIIKINDMKFGEQYRMVDPYPTKLFFEPTIENLFVL
jgi:hypothetical protein